MIPRYTRPELAAIERRAFEHKLTPTIGRSHGIHAEPTTFGLKLAGAYAEFARGRDRLSSARKEVATCAISGAVGTFAQVDPRVEAHVAKAMGLEVDPQSMRRNLDRLGGLIHSQRVMLALTHKGVAREEAYRLVQRNAMKAWSGEGDFGALLDMDPEVRKHLSKAEIAACLDLDIHLRHVDTIFQRVFGKA